MATSKKRARQQVHVNARKRVTRKKLAEYADSDTPESVKVGANFQNLVVWAVGRFGIGIIFLGLAWVFYQDQRKDQEIMRKDNADMRQVIRENNEAINSLRRAVDNLTNTRN